MDWSEEAAEMFKELLRQLPAGVRGSVRDAAEARAESMAQEEDEDEVSMETAVLALMREVPEDWRDPMKDAMVYHGLDPEEYESKD